MAKLFEGSHEANLLSGLCIISIPFGFLCGYLGTVLSRTPADPEKFAELEVRAMTGAGAH